VTSHSLAVGAVQVTAVCDVVANFPDPLPQAFPEPFGTITRSGDGRHWSGRP
jgi:hypothetical protein